jgi:serine/threonine protein kinase
VHPTRIHYNNGLAKFNLVGLPYNFKKLLKCMNFSGHVNYTSPEIISEEQNFSNTDDFNNDETSIFTAKAETWSLGCCLFNLATKKDPFEGQTAIETKSNILNMKFNYPKVPIDPVVNNLIMKCLEPNPAKRLDVKGIIKYLDSLEMINYGDFISQINFEKILEQHKAVDEVVQRAEFDEHHVDYTGMNLNLRNNPWFFSKKYSYTNRPKDGIYPVLDSDY